MVQGRSDIPGLAAIKAALELGQCKHTSTRKGPAKRPMSLESCWEDAQGHSVFSRRFPRFAWLSHGGIRKMRMMRGMWHLQSAQPSGRGARKLALQDTSHAWGLQAEETPLTI